MVIRACERVFVFVCHAELLIVVIARLVTLLICYLLLLSRNFSNSIRLSRVQDNDGERLAINVSCVEIV